MGQNIHFQPPTNTTTCFLFDFTSAEEEQDDEDNSQSRTHTAKDLTEPEMHKFIDIE